MRLAEAFIVMIAESGQELKFNEIKMGEKLFFCFSGCGLCGWDELLLRWLSNVFFFCLSHVQHLLQRVGIGVRVSHYEKL